jgi:hypothetical protein
VTRRARRSRLLARQAGGFDFEGDTVAWTTTRCRQTVIRTATVPSLLRRPAPPDRCPGRR